jgi:regulator of sirC expression with transglutaminase-like and TPR domain
MRRAAFILIMLLVFAPEIAFADPAALKKQIESLFAPNADLLDIKLAADQLAGDKADQNDTRQKIKALEQSLLSSTDRTANARQKYFALKRFIYDAGAWNNNVAFSYDMIDPLGRKPENRLLSNYLLTRKGNCITMPVLAVLLGRKLGLDMTLALAPFHSFVKFKGDDGREFNLEATSGLGGARDQHYRDQLPMSDTAVAKGTYLRALSHDEMVATLVEPALSRAMAEKRYGDASVIVDVLLKHAPNIAELHVWRGSIYGHLLEDQFVIPFGRQIPPEMRPVADFYLQNQNSAFAIAEALGWRENQGHKGVPVQ